MKYLENDASELYLQLSKICFHAEKLSWTHYLDRMVVLRVISEKSDPVHQHASRILNIEEWVDEDGWASKVEEEYDDSDEIVQSNASSDILQDVRPGLSKDRNGNFQFLSKRKGLKNWHFHQYDADFHPSVPHGHYMRKSQPKLDSYLGWIYKGSKQIGRLKKDLIIDLWNDEEFRIFAYTALEWFTVKNPSFHWRVPDPLILPKRR